MASGNTADAAHEPPVGLAGMASFGALLNDAELGVLADWTCDLADFVERLASLDPSLGLPDGHAIVRDAKALMHAGTALHSLSAGTDETERA